MSKLNCLLKYFCFNKTVKGIKFIIFYFLISRLNRMQTVK